MKGMKIVSVKGCPGHTIPRHPISRQFAITLLLAAALLGAPFSSCRLATAMLSGSETVTVYLPAPHPVYALLNVRPSYTARWYTADGMSHEKAGVSAPFDIDLPAGKMAPILLYCESEAIGIPADCLPPAGCLYPVHAGMSGRGVTVEAGWARGIDAELTERICRSAAGGFGTGLTIAEHFNWQRFDRELATVENPLALDRGRFLDAVLSGYVSVYDIAASDVFPAPLGLPRDTIADGTDFLPAWPGGKGFTWTQEPQPAVSVTEGRTVFFCSTGYLTVQAENGRPGWSFFTRYTLQD